MLQARGDQVLGPARVRGENLGEIPKSVENVFLFNALASLEKAEDSAALAGSSLEQYLKGLPDLAPVHLLPPRRILLFDQFEEIFTSYPEHWQSRPAFFREIGAALQRDPCLRVLFAMREEYIASLDPYASKLPDSLQPRFRLEPLGDKAALDAIEEPPKAIRSRWKFAEGAARKLVENLRRVSGKPSGSVAVVSGEFVEPVQLQVVCRRLWQSLPPVAADAEEEPEITLDYIQVHGDVDTALTEYYEDCIREAVQTTGMEETSLRRWFAETLITPEGTRDLVKVGREIPSAALDLLAKQHLVRAEVRAGSAGYYELIHDRFIQPVLTANRRWQEARKLSRGDLEAMLDARAYRQSEVRRVSSKLGRPARIYFKMDASSSPEDMLEDRRTAERIFALEVLEGGFHLARGIGPDSYPQLEKEWLSDVERLKAYLIWEERSGAAGDGFQDEEDYYEACRVLRCRLTEPRAKAAAEELDPFEDYLLERYLDTKGRLDRSKESTRALITRKAQRIYDTGRTGGADEDWNRAVRYAELFYESILLAARTPDEAGTLKVLEAFRFCKRPDNRFLIINCFEAALAIYFLDPAVVTGLWKKGAITEDSTL